MSLLIHKRFEEGFGWSNKVGPLHKAAARILPARLWVNPDCGLKTRAWTETEAALANMVAAARLLRSEVA